MYAINYSKEAVRALRKMPRNVSKLIMSKIDQLASNPYSAQQVKKLQGINGFRLRVGDWRVIYTVNDQEMEVIVIRVASRGEVYQ